MDLIWNYIPIGRSRGIAGIRPGPDPQGMECSETEIIYKGHG